MVIAILGVLAGVVSALVHALLFQSSDMTGASILDLIAIALGVIQTIALAWITANTRVRRK